METNAEQITGNSSAKSRRQTNTCKSAPHHGSSRSSGSKTYYTDRRPYPTPITSGRRAALASARCQRLSSSDREFARRFDLLQGDLGVNVSHAVDHGQLLHLKALVVVEIRNYDPQQVVVAPRHQVTLQDVVRFHDLGCEVLDRYLVLPIERHPDEDGESQTDGCGVQQCRIAVDDPRLLEEPYPAQAR